MCRVDVTNLFLQMFLTLVLDVQQLIGDYRGLSGGLVFDLDDRDA